MSYNIINYFKNEIEESFRRLETVAEYFFQNRDRIQDIFGNPNDSLLHHLHDFNWLAHKIYASQSIKEFTLPQIETYVMCSSVFRKQLHDYQLSVVKRLIEWIIEGRESYISDKEYDEEMMSFHESYDIGFREKIAEKLKKSGMDFPVVEEGIESNTALWLEKTMNNTFGNRFNPLFVLTHPNLQLADKEHQEKWLKFRRFAYYHRYKDSVDRYGTIHPDMTMTSEEVSEIYTYLKQKNAERSQYLQKEHALLCESENQGMLPKKTIERDKQGC